MARVIVTAPTRYRQAETFDAQGFDRPVPTRSFLVPVGWTVEGGAFWSANPCIADRLEERLQITSPDGSARLARLPHYTWQWSGAPYAAMATGGCRFGPPMNAGEVLERVIVPFVTGGRPVRLHVTRDEGRARVALERDANTPGRAAVLGMGGTVDADAADARFELDGRDEHLQITVVAVSIPTPMGPSMSFVGQDVWHTSTAPDARSWAPEVYGTVLGSMRVNPEWTAAVRAVTDEAYRMQREHSAAMHRITMDGIRQRTQAMARQNDWLQHVRVQDTSSAQDALHASWMRQQESSDRVARQASEAIREVDSWGIDGGRVELPSGYDRAFSNGLGEYVVTDDPSFDPSALPGVWSPLARVR